MEGAIEHEGDKIREWGKNEGTLMCRASLKLLWHQPGISIKNKTASYYYWSYINIVTILSFKQINWNS